MKLLILSSLIATVIKNVFKWVLPIIVATTLITYFAACTSTTTPQQQVEVAKLLDRPAALQNDLEWDRVQNTYGTATAQLREQPEHAESYIKLLEVFILEARVTGEHGHYYPAALDLVDQFLELPNKDNDTYFQALSIKASVLLSQHDFKQALVYAQKAALINPYNAQIFGTLADAYVELGQYEKAVAAADKMMSIRPDLRSYARISYLREIYGDIDGSIEAMKMATKAGYPGYEESAWTRLTLGNIYQTYGKLDEAQNEYQRTLQERVNYPFAIGALASIEMENEKYDEAEKLLKEACAIIPEFSFYVQLAEIYKATDRPKLYQETMDEIFVMLQDDVDSGHNMNLEYADLHLRVTEDYNKALEYALLEYEKRPDNIDVNKMLALIYFEQDQKEKFKNHLVLATRTNSKHPDIVRLQTASSYTAM